MRLISRYIAREIAVPACLALAVIGFLAIGNEFQERLELLPTEHLTVFDLIRFAAYFSPTLISYVVPITYMMGILLAFGLLAQNNEITAMKAAGIPLKRLVIPVIGGGALISLACFFVQDRAQPYALGKAYDLIYQELQERITADVLPAGKMHDMNGVHVYFGGKDPETGTLKDVKILEPDEDGKVVVYYAKSAQVVTKEQQSRVILNDSYSIFVLEGGNLGFLHNPRAELPLPKNPPLTRQSERRLLTLKDCLKREKELAKNPGEARDLRKMRTEIAERFSMPLMAFAVSFLAAPLAVRARQGGRSYSFAIGACIVLVFFLFRMVLEPSGLHSLNEVILRAMAPNIVLILAGCWALWRVDRI